MKMNGAAAGQVGDSVPFCRAASSGVQGLQYFLKIVEELSYGRGSCSLLS
jgi:hypothetical protein